MITLWTTIDGALIDNVFQRATDKFAGWTGIGHRRVARFFLHCAAVEAGTSFLYEVMMNGMNFENYINALSVMSILYIVAFALKNSMSSNGIGYSRALPAARLVFLPMRGFLMFTFTVWGLMGICLQYQKDGKLSWFFVEPLPVALLCGLILLSAYCFACRSNPPPVQKLSHAIYHGA
jgi:hypothetical protein